VKNIEKLDFHKSSGVLAFPKRKEEEGFSNHI